MNSVSSVTGDGYFEKRMLAFTGRTSSFSQASYGKR